MSESSNTPAEADSRKEQADRAYARSRTFPEATRLAAVIARTGLDPWDAHVAAVADASVWAILTLEAGLRPARVSVRCPP